MARKKKGRRKKARRKKATKKTTRKKAGRRRAKTTRKKGRRKAKTTRKKVRRRKKNPGMKRNPRRRRRRKAVAASPRRKRRRRRKKNPVARRPVRRRRRRRTLKGRFMNPRRRRRMRRNAPVKGATKAVRGELKKVVKVQEWLAPSLHGALGIGVANYGPALLSRYTGQLGLRNFGLGGVVLSAVSTGLGAGIAGYAATMLPKKGLIGKATAGIAKHMFVGGMIWTTIRLLNEVVPALAARLYLPRATAGMALPAPAAPANAAGLYGLLPGGYHYPGQYGGLGMVTTPEELVAGESLARQVGQFRGMNDWMTLEGMGGVPYGVPTSQILGMGGMNDWMAMNPEGSFAMQEFSPGTETF